MKLRNTLALLVIAVALGGLIFGLDRYSQSTRQRRERAAHLGPVDQRNIQGFTVQNGDELIRVQAEGDDWKMVAPWTDAADIGLVNQLLDAVQTLHAEDTITDLGKGEKKRNLLKDFGLNKPRLRLRLEGQRMPGEFQFGQDAAVRGACYLRLSNDDAVYVVGNDLKRIVSRKADDFRDHRMTPFLTPLIERAIFRVNGGEIELSKEQDNWLLQRPIKARASNDAVVGLLTRINQTQIVKFISDEKGGAASFGVEAPSRAVTLFGGESEKAEILIGNPMMSQPELIYAQLPQRRCLVGVQKEFAALFDLTPNDLRDRKICRLNTDLIDRVSIEKIGQPSLVLGRQENRWRFLGPTQSLANAHQVTSLIESLNEGEITNYVSDTATDLTKYGLDRPKLKIIFSSYSSENTAEANAGETVLATLAFGNSEGGVTYARLEEEPYIFSISDKFLRDLPQSEIDFRTLDILQLRREELRTVRLEKPGEKTIELTRGEKRKWVISGDQARPDESQIQTFLNTLTGLRAAAWLDGAVSAQNPKELTLAVTIRYQSGEVDREVRLNFGPANSENQHSGTSTEQTGSFLIDDAQFERLKGLLGN